VYGTFKMRSDSYLLQAVTHFLKAWSHVLLVSILFSVEFSLVFSFSPSLCFHFSQLLILVFLWLVFSSSAVSIHVLFLIVSSYWVLLISTSFFCSSFSYGFFIFPGVKKSYTVSQVNTGILNLSLTGMPLLPNPQVITLTFLRVIRTQY
jgi:hypothetical protein